VHFGPYRGEMQDGSMEELNVWGPHGRQFSRVLKVSHLTLSFTLMDCQTPINM